MYNFTFSPCFSPPWEKLPTGVCRQPIFLISNVDMVFSYFTNRSTVFSTRSSSARNGMVICPVPA